MTTSTGTTRGAAARPTGPAAVAPVAPTTPGRNGRTARVLVIADQALSSATNALMTIVAARLLAPSAFGLVTIGFGAYVLALGLTRAMTGETVLVLLPRADRGRTWTERDALGASLVAGALLGAVALGAVAVVGTGLGWILLALAIGLPLLMLLDTSRYLFAARRQPERAIAVDATWALGMLVVLAGFPAVGGSWTPAAVFGAWVGTGMVAGVVALAMLTSVPSLTGARRFVGETRTLSTRFATDFVLSSLGAQLTILVLAVFLPAAEIGALNGAQLLIAIPTLLCSAMVVVAVAEWSRDSEHGSATLRSRALRLGSILGLACALWVGLLLVDPGGLGRALLGATWPAARALLLPFGIVIALRGFAVGANSGLRALGDGSAILRARLVAAPAAFVLAVAGAHWGGPEGAAYGLAAGSIVWVVMLHRSMPPAQASERVGRRPSRSRSS